MGKNTRKHLDLDMFSCHYDSERIQFSKKIGSWLYDGGYEFMIWNGNNLKAISFNDKKQEIGIGKCVPISYGYYQDGTIRAQIYAKGVARDILRKFGLRNESWYFRMRNFTGKEQLDYTIFIEPIESMKRQTEQPLFRKCAKCGRELPLSEYYRRGKSLQSYCKDCMKEHGRLRNGTTGEYKQSYEELAKYSDLELYNELKRRGYDGTMKKTNHIGMNYGRIQV